MPRVAILLTGLLLWVASVAGVFVTVLSPARQNLLAGRLEAARSAPPRVSRDLVSRPLPRLMDPAIDGRLVLAEARALSRLGRTTDAVQSYREAVERGVFPDQVAEAGLYLLRHGDPLGREYLVRAGRYSPVLLNGVQPRSLREELLAEVGVDG